MLDSEFDRRRFFSGVGLTAFDFVEFVKEDDVGSGEAFFLAEGPKQDFVADFTESGGGSIEREFTLAAGDGVGVPA